MRINDGGGGSSPSLGSSLFSAMPSFTGAAKSVARKTATSKKKKGAVSRSIDLGASLGLGTQRSSKPVTRRRTSPQRNYQPVRRSSPQRNYQTPARISRPASGATPGGAIAPTVPAPVIPKFNDAYLAGDTAYSAQKAAYDKALADYVARSTGEATNYNTEYNAKLGTMQKAQDQGALDLKDDYASRGLLSSGVYADALNDFNNSYTTQRDELARAKQQYETDLANSKTDFTTEQQTLLAKARQDALNRYNDKYKV